MSDRSILLITGIAAIPAWNARDEASNAGGRMAQETRWSGWHSPAMIRQFSID